MPPRIIYLQCINPEDNQELNPFVDEITWSQNPINNNDIQYIRMDTLAQEPIIGELAYNAVKELRPNLIVMLEKYQALHLSPVSLLKSCKYHEDISKSIFELAAEFIEKKCTISCIRCQLPYPDYIDYEACPNCGYKRIVK